MILILIPVLVVYPYQAAAESQYLAKGDKHAVVYLRQRRQNEARREHCAPEDAQCDSEYQLKMFHTYISAQTCAKTYPRRVLYLVWFLKPN